MRDSPTISYDTETVTNAYEHMPFCFVDLSELRMQTMTAGLDEEALTPPGPDCAWQSAAGQPHHMPSIDSSTRSHVGPAQGFRRPGPAGRIAHGAFPVTQMVPRSAQTLQLLCLRYPLAVSPSANMQS